VNYLDLAELQQLHDQLPAAVPLPRHARRSAHRRADCHLHAIALGETLNGAALLRPLQFLLQPLDLVHLARQSEARSTHHAVNRTSPAGSSELASLHCRRLKSAKRLLCEFANNISPPRGGGRRTGLSAAISVGKVERMAKTKKRSDNGRKRQSIGGEHEHKEMRQVETRSKQQQQRVMVQRRGSGD